MHSLRRAVCALLAGVVLLAACGKSEPPPPPPKAEPPQARRPDGQRRIEAAGGGGLRLRVSARADGRHARRRYRGTAARHIPPHARASRCEDAGVKPERRLPVLAGVARPVRWAGDPLGARHQGALLPDRDPRRVDQRRGLARQADHRHREGRVRDRGSDLEGHAAGWRLGGALADGPHVALRADPDQRRRGHRRRHACPERLEASAVEGAGQAGRQIRGAACGDRRGSRRRRRRRAIRSRRWTRRRSTHASRCCSRTTRPPRTTRR